MTLCHETLVWLVLNPQLIAHFLFHRFTGVQWDALFTGTEWIWRVGKMLKGMNSSSLFNIISTSLTLWFWKFGPFSFQILLSRYGPSHWIRLHVPVRHGPVKMEACLVVGWFMLIFETTHCNKTSFQVRFHEWISHECTQKKGPVS